jgi:hypothetical protein
VRGLSSAHIWMARQWPPNAIAAILAPVPTAVEPRSRRVGTSPALTASPRAQSDRRPSVPAGSAGRAAAVGNEASAVSWAAIFAGAFAALALTVVLTSLGAGLGLTTISAWPNSGAAVTTFTISAGIGLIVVQWLASALGGFITGRLRIKWTGVYTHEVFFRDTAHGFLSWALACGGEDRHSAGRRPETCG